MAEPVKTIMSVKVGHVMIMQFAQIQKEVSTANVKMVILKMDMSVLKLMNVRMESISVLFMGHVLILQDHINANAILDFLEMGVFAKILTNVLKIHVRKMQIALILEAPTHAVVEMDTKVTDSSVLTSMNV